MGPEFRQIDHRNWLSQILYEYIRLSGMNQDDYSIDIEDVLRVIQV